MIIKIRVPVQVISCLCCGICNVPVIQSTRVQVLLELLLVFIFPLYSFLFINANLKPDQDIYQNLSFQLVCTNFSLNIF